MTIAATIVSELWRNPIVIRAARHLDPNSYEDLIQDVSLLMLKMGDAKLAEVKKIEGFFFICARNVLRQSERKRCINIDTNIDIEDVDLIDEVEQVDLYEEAEKIMLNAGEFENRIVQLHAQHGSLLKVSRELGIGYSVLRTAKKKLHENTSNNTNR